MQFAKWPMTTVVVRAASSNPGGTSANLTEIQTEFTSQAAAFEAEWAARARTSNDDLMRSVFQSIDAVTSFPSDARALDIACGTGVFTRALAKACGPTIGLDATEAMLSQARATEIEVVSAEPGDAERTDRPQQYICGDAMALPFDDNTFDIVGTRLAVHHFPDPAPIAREMARVCKPGGLVVLVDLTSVDEAAAAAVHNHLEILRDPTHTRALTETELRGLLPSVGPFEALVPPADSDAAQYLPVVYDLENWMDVTNTPSDARAEIGASFDTELAGGAPTGMHAHRDADGRICFVHRWVTAVSRHVAV